MNLTRNVAQGRILSNGVGICLRGGHYDLFNGSGTPVKAYYRTGEGTPFVLEFADPTTCDFGRLAATTQAWGDKPWADLFDKLQQTGCNLLRIWLTNGSRVVNGIPTDRSPFLLHHIGNAWKWQVEDAVVRNIWDEAFFTRLRDFVTVADSRHVAVQISLFNYNDIYNLSTPTIKTWEVSIFNPANCQVNNPGWEYGHLVYRASGGHNEFDDAGKTTAREQFFIQPTNDLPMVQEAIVRKVVHTLQGCSNVILEIMNEPHLAATVDQSAAFANRVVGWILAAAGTWRPLISMNASLISAGDNPNFQFGDWEWWFDHRASLPHYDDIDIVSFHGLTGYNTVSQTVCTHAADASKRAYLWNMSRVDAESINRRWKSFKIRDSSKTILFCTDAVKDGPFSLKLTVGTHEDSISLRDGQMTTRYPNTNTDPADEQRRRSDLENWAAWVFKIAKADPGMAHFQNHSTNITTYDRIKAAWDHPA